MLTQLLSIKGRKLESSLERNKQKRAIWQDPSGSIAADPGGQEHSVRFWQLSLELDRNDAWESDVGWTSQ